MSELIPKSTGWQWKSKEGFSSNWEWECESLVDSDGHVVIELADTYPGYPECGEQLVMKISPEHARLIAAAPGLLEACEMMIDSARPSKSDHPSMFKAWENARLAISKATKGTQ